MTGLYYFIGGIFTGGLVAAAIYFWWKRRKGKDAAIESAYQHAGEIQTRLDSVLKLNRSLVEATDEKQLLDGLLEMVVSATKTAGATYIPLDELGQPLAQFSKGITPRYPHQPWTERLVGSPAVEICRACQKLHKDINAECPLADNPFAPEGEITCLTIQRGARRLGIINLYHKPGQSLTAEDITFLQDMMAETSLAVDNLRFHNQEMATLRQLQMVHHSAEETTEFLSRLLDNTAEVLECDLIILTHNHNGGISETTLRGRQAAARIDQAALKDLTSRLQDGLKPIILPAGSEPLILPDVSSLAAVPVLSAAGAWAGSLVAARLGPEEFDQHAIHILETTASQVSLMVENERKILELEYRAVMDERSRLAREIHDGLAQNLAFLKLQTAQMNGFLLRGELEDLGDMIRTNQQVLTDAYAETRQAINHLRLSAQPGVRSWLNDVIEDFRKRGDVTVDLTIQRDPETLPVEIQLQLIRILQEALNNIRKHSRAARAQITFRGYEGDLIMEITDDGRGFLSDDIPSISQYGLRGMRERCELIGAEFQIISQPGSGTTIRLQLPYAYTEEAPL